MSQQENDVQRLLTALIETAEVLRQAARTLREVAADLASQAAAIMEGADGS